MALPINTAAQYSLVIPSTGERVKYRPFLVKEEKALLLAQQSEDPITMVETLKNIIASCVTGDYKVDNLATFDLEYIFTQIRGKSVGETVELLFPCDVCEDEKAKVKISFDITKIQVEKSPEHNKKIELFGDVGVLMKYPTIDIIKKLENIDNANLDEAFNIIIECIDAVYDSSQVYHAKEQSREELLQFLNNLSSEQFSKVQKFFETMPKMSHAVDYKCPVCGTEHHKVLEGLNSFF